MPCRPFKWIAGTGEVATGLLCSAPGRSKKDRIKPCHYCSNTASVLCDHPVFRNNVKETCDTPMCAACTNKIAEEVDLCRPHFNEWRNNGRKFLL